MKLLRPLVTCQAPGCLVHGARHLSKHHPGTSLQILRGNSSFIKVHPGWGLADSGTRSSCWRLNEAFHISQKDAKFQIQTFRLKLSLNFRLYRASAHSLMNKAGKFGHSYRAAAEPKVQEHCLACCACHICSLIYQEEPGNEKQVALRPPRFLAAIIGLPARCQNYYDSQLASGTEPLWSTIPEHVFPPCQPAGPGAEISNPVHCKQKPQAIKLCRYRHLLWTLYRNVIPALMSKSLVGNVLAISHWLGQLATKIQ